MLYVLVLTLDWIQIKILYNPNTFYLHQCISKHELKTYKRD